jgi:methyl-accepting chemotaxis protein WspA
VVGSSAAPHDWDGKFRMKKLTIWQRLNTALAFLILLLLIGVGLAFWIEKSRSSAELTKVQLTSDKDRLLMNIVIMSDGLRGLMLDPANEIEKRRRQGAEGDMSPALDSLMTRRPELSTAVRKVRDFWQGPLSRFHTRVLELHADNPAEAVAYYNQNYPVLREQRTKLFDELNQQVGRAVEADAIRARTNSAIGSVCIVVIFFACLVVGRMQSAAVTKPLTRLVSTLERLRRGDFTQRMALERSDEFGVLSEGLNRLADDLSALVGQVQRSGIQVNVTATQIAATAREQQSTASEIAATTAQIGATSKEISATSKELVKTMNEVSEVSEETAQLANSGQTAIARMESTMRQIMEASGSITAKLAVLSEKTSNINSVVTTITKVADQTNLLSLNAAIEAEKAGEYGLGFAVVAMEIRRLADQTAVATYDIEKMVKEMQSAVSAGVMGMDKFSEEARRGVEEIRQVSTQLAQIIHQVQTLTPRFHTVNEGMHAQATGAQQISETLTQLSDAAHQTAESLRQSNLAIDQLNEAARGLQTSVARFKLES